MLDFAKSRASSPRDVPVEIDAALARPDWRARISSPVGLAEANAIAASQTGRALDWALGLGDDLARDAGLLALPNILAYGRAIVLAALAVSRAAASGMRLTGGSPELDYLATGEGEVPARADPVLPAPRIPFALARRLARIESWTRFGQLPRAILRPDAVVVGHNPLLRAVAAGDARALGFRYADALLASARARAGTAPDLEEHLPALAEILCGEILSEEPYRARALALLKATAHPHLAKAGRDMAALRALPLPHEVWSGSGGLHAPRAIGLEVLRRGGRVRRFDHGTPRGFVASSDYTALLELAVSSEFVLATEGAAEICRADTAGRLEQTRGVVQGASGDPTYAAIPAYRTRRAGTARPRVVYAPTQLLGFRQLLPVQPPDVVYLDWQLRVAEALRDLPIDFICQPHPEGLLRDVQHPLEQVATTIRGHFSAQLDSADVFVFDFPATTALWEAACTDARIVFLDIGAGTMTKAVAKLFHERARVLGIAHDEANRPILDIAALRDAVLDAGRPVDPMPFRRLLAGEA